MQSMNSLLDGPMLITSFTSVVARPVEESIPIGK